MKSNCKPKTELDIELSRRSLLQGQSRLIRKEVPKGLHQVLAQCIYETTVITYHSSVAGQTFMQRGWSLQKQLHKILLLSIIYDPARISFRRKEKKQIQEASLPESLEFSHSRGSCDACIVNFYAENIVHFNQQLVVTFLSCAVMRFLC